MYKLYIATQKLNFDYHLMLPWLQDMMKHSVNAKKAHSDLQQALDRMLKVLKNLNDSLHVVGLKGFPVSSLFIFVVLQLRSSWYIEYSS